MNGRKVVLDSNIIIYLSKGQLNIEDILERYDELCISIITYMEVMGFRFSDEGERQIIQKLLDHFAFIYINAEIVEWVISIRKEKKIKLPDAIILATAKVLNCDLLTRNVRDFQAIVKGVGIIDPFEHR
jgi:hypothetical protein